MKIDNKIIHDIIAILKDSNSPILSMNQIAKPLFIKYKLDGYYHTLDNDDPHKFMVLDGQSFSDSLYFHMQMLLDQEILVLAKKPSTIQNSLSPGFTYVGKKSITEGENNFYINIDANTYFRLSYKAFEYL